MATRRPVLCPNCGAHIRKNGYCTSCNMNYHVLMKAYNTSDYYYNQGYDRAAARDLSGAVDSLMVALRYNKKNVPARNLLGLIHYEMGEVVEALRHWVMSVNYQPQTNLASRYLKELKTDPTRLANVDQIAKKFNMALDYIDRGDHDLAILQLKNALSENPHFVKGYLLLALLYIHAGNYEKARVALRRVLRVDKANPVAIHYLREMGTSDENIIHMRQESIEDDGLFEDLMVTVDKDDEELTIRKEEVKRPIFKEIAAKRNESVVRTGEFSQLSLARYSGIYVLLGIVIGIMVLYFAVVPHQRKKMLSENENLIRSYSEELADKNATISAQQAEIDSLNNEIVLMRDKATSTDALPDYSKIKNGMSEEDLDHIMDTE